ncbi:hypothetical protein ACWEOE_34255 [Amycolatopsis sp. NPDC004368]
MARVAAPYKTGNAYEIVGKLQLGEWMIFPHEWAYHGLIDPEAWRQIVQAACDEDGVPVTFVVLPKQDLTVLFNPAMTPTFDELQASIDAMLHYRWKNEALPSETRAKTGSDTPLADFRAQLARQGRR